jgi:hypothetical protein
MADKAILYSMSCPNSPLASSRNAISRILSLVPKMYAPAEDTLQAELDISPERALGNDMGRSV